MHIMYNKMCKINIVYVDIIIALYNKGGLKPA